MKGEYHRATANSDNNSPESFHVKSTKPVARFYEEICQSVYISCHWLLIVLVTTLYEVLNMKCHRLLAYA